MLKPRAKLSTQSSVKFTTGKHIMIVTASKRYFSRLILVDWCHNLMRDFFPNFCGETSRRESASGWSKQTVKENTNTSEWIAQKISIFVFAFANISTPSLFWEIYGWTFQALWMSKTSCSYQKLLQIETGPDCLRLMILEAVLHLLVLKQGNLFDAGELLN